MAFNPINLFRIGGNNGMQGPSLWLYTTTDAITVVDDAAHFVACKYRGMNVADVVIVSKTGTPAGYICYVTAISAAGDATVSAGTVVA
jgi:hypothetical protein